MAESYLPMEIQHHQLLFSVKDAIFDSGHFVVFLSSSFFLLTSSLLQFHLHLHL